jgi:hypothetical protein
VLSISDFRLHFENKWKNKKNHQKKVNIASQYLEQCHLLLKFCCLFCPLICNSLKGKKQWHSIKNIDINVKKQVHTNFTITKLKTLRHWIPSLWNTHPYSVCGFIFFYWIAESIVILLETCWTNDRKWRGSNSWTLQDTTSIQHVLNVMCCSSWCNNFKQK